MNDNPKPESTRLHKLKQQQEKLKKQIAREKTRLSGQSRKNDTRRKILTGAVLIEAAENDTNLKRTIETLLRSKLTRKDDRALFGLPPLPGEKNKKPYKVKKTPDGFKTLFGKK